MTAAAAGHTHIVLYLIEGGAVIDVRDKVRPKQFYLHNTQTYSYFSINDIS